MHVFSFGVSGWFPCTSKLPHRVIHFKEIPVSPLTAGLLLNGIWRTALRKQRAARRDIKGSNRQAPKHHRRVVHRVKALIGNAALICE